MGPTPDSPICPPPALESLKGIELVARSLVERALLGLHRSPYHGFSSEFAGDRKYAPGDSIRYLDWKALARSGKYFIKEFEEESNLASYVILDSSRVDGDGRSGGAYGEVQLCVLSGGGVLLSDVPAARCVGVVVYSDEVTALRRRAPGGRT